MRVRIDIRDVVVRARAERHQIERVAPAVKEAFRLLGEQLDRTPAGWAGEGRERVIASLDTDDVPLDELLSARGAERLADAWYRQLVGDRP
jgi:hypothetical protein